MEQNRLFCCVYLNIQASVRFVQFFRRWYVVFSSGRSQPSHTSLVMQLKGLRHTVNPTLDHYPWLLFLLFTDCWCCDCIWISICESVVVWYVMYPHEVTRSPHYSCSSPWQLLLLVLPVYQVHWPILQLEMVYINWQASCPFSFEYVCSVSLLCGVDIHIYTYPLPRLVSEHYSVGILHPSGG